MLKRKRKAERRVLLTVSKSEYPWHKLLLRLLMCSLLVLQSIKKCGLQGSERQTPYDLTINRNLINKMNKQSIAKDTEIENRLTVIRRERGGDHGGKG